jgi:hypothetical protein
MNIIDFVNTLKDNDFENNVFALGKYLKKKKYSTLRDAVSDLKEISERELKLKFDANKLEYDAFSSFDPDTKEEYDLPLFRTALDKHPLEFYLDWKLESIDFKYYESVDGILEIQLELKS